MDTSILDNIIYGRIEPHIYAFKTNTIPNYLKVGDTYRSVKLRLDEWRQIYKDLEPQFDAKALINDDVYFRDYSVHEYLENDKHRKRLLPKDLKSGVYYSKEFFEDTSTKDIEEAIDDIKKSYKNNTGKYQYYNSADKTTEDFVYQRSDVYWKPRPNQSEAIENFKKAIKRKRNSQKINLLMYAVMRFGKSFTSLCCAKEMHAKFVLVLSGKADVKDEWKKNVEVPANFKNFYFFDSDYLKKKNTDDFTAALKKKNTCVVLFLTLQDLQGKTVKEKHKEVFKQNIDLLIVDETHFGARASSYGEVLRNVELYENEKPKDYGAIDSEQADKQVEELKKVLKVHVTLHLSGTPYRILMGSEFEKEDIISFCQFSNIMEEQKKWEIDNFKRINDEDLNVITGKPYQEWDNPYFGFPQMVRFAFRPNKSSFAKINNLKEIGKSASFSVLFNPKSTKKDDDGEYLKFENESEILDFLKVIDGSKEDENILGFLNYKKLKDGKMCRHIVMVLPFRASCDSLQQLLKRHQSDFINLNQYEIINIAGFDSEYDKIGEVTETIKKFETAGKKTISLTVHKMLTGVTVPEWDTMLMLKECSSPEEYDQAIFRLQNQYIKDFKSPDGNVIKYNMKPQTLLVDFDPTRMFKMQESKSLIYNVNTDEGGNNKLYDRIGKELAISPIITINHDKIVEITPQDIVDEVRKYSATRGVAEETGEIPVDINLQNIELIREEIERQNELGSKGGLNVLPTTEEGEELEITDDDDSCDGNEPTAREKGGNDNILKEEIESYINKFRTYYARILFFAFLTKDKVVSLNDIINISKQGENPRILKNLALNVNVLKAINTNMAKIGLNQLDYKIQNINTLANDSSVEPLERANVALKKFGRLSDSEVVTPSEICDEMVNLISDTILLNVIDKKKCILDINSKLAEFPLAIYKRYTEKLKINPEKIQNIIYSIPSSSHTYEFTRKVYELLGLNVSNIAEHFVSYDLLKIINEKEKIDFNGIKKLLNQQKEFNQIFLTNKNSQIGENDMKFDVIVGNPPYQIETKTENSKNGQAPRTNIFHYFENIAIENAQEASALIFPAVRWIHRSGKGLKEFGLKMINDNRLEKIVYYPNATEIFENTEIADGISIVVTNTKKSSDNFEFRYKDKNVLQTINVNCPGDELLVLNPNDKIIVDKIKTMVKNLGIKYLHDGIYPRTLFGIESDFVEKNSKKVRPYNTEKDFNPETEIKLLTNDKSGSAGRSSWFIVNRNTITQSKNLIDEWQVVVSSAHGGGQDGRDNQIAIIDNHSAFGRSKVALKSFKTKKEAENFLKYAKSIFVRYAFLMTDEALTSLGMYVPDFIDYSDTNKYLDFSKDIDKQIIKLMKFSDDEFKYMETVTNKKK